MKTLHPILIGLSLIAAAIFFKDTAVKSAYAYAAGGQKVAICNINGKVCATVRDDHLLRVLISNQ